MKKVIIVFCLVLVLCITSCAANNDTQYIEKLDAEETYPDFPGSLVVIYDSLEEIENDSEVIAEVEVLDNDVIELDGLPRTHSYAEVISVIKGDLNTGETIEIIEEGCNTVELVLTVGVPPMEVGNKYVLCMTKLDNEYFINGAFQGKFIEKDGYAIQQGTSETKLANYTPIKVDAFKKNILTMVDKNVAEK